MTLEYVYRQLMITRGSLEVALASIDMVLSQIAPAPASPDAEKADNDGVCRHPIEMRVPSPTMGHLDRFLCQNCKQLVDP